jgi:uncharacterized Zn-binding protein involved in type VI secretion
MGKKIARKDDQNTTGGKLMEGGCAGTVFADFKKVALMNCPITPHEPFSSKSAHQPHKEAKVNEPSPTVYAEFKQVVRVTSSNTCGHVVKDNDATVYVP